MSLRIKKRQLVSIFLSLLIFFGSFSLEFFKNNSWESFSLGSISYGASLNGLSLDDFKSLPVQSGGRLKPYDTFAKETLKFIYGREKFEGQKAHVVVLSWILVPKDWEEISFVRVSHESLRKFLGLDEARQLFSPKELNASSRLAVAIKEVVEKKSRGETLTGFYEEVSDLERKLALFYGVVGGMVPGVMSPKAGPDWLVPRQLSPEQSERFSKLLSVFASLLVRQKASGKDLKEASKNLENGGLILSSWISDQNLSSRQKRIIRLEVFYNWINPFLLAWVLYLLALLAIGVFTIWKTSLRPWVAGTFIFGGVAFHILGFVLRSLITSRAPVSNMYETVVWVSLLAILATGALHLFFPQGRKILWPAALIVSAFCLILTDLAPLVLDPTLQPLEPVLRDNFWLVIHVLITSGSYAPFFLAFAVGIWVLALLTSGGAKNKPRLVKHGVEMIYRCEQIGVVMMAAGTILGGVWADYSWGRFWGWDPKETWALIVVLVYLAVLHARLVGWLGPFGMAVAAVLSFLSVIMAWYGVNFILGQGLHSYGFGAGGVEYVSGFVFLVLGYVGFATWIRYQQMRV